MWKSDLEVNACILCKKRFFSKGVKWTPLTQQGIYRYAVLFGGSLEGFELWTFLALKRNATAGTFSGSWKFAGSENGVIFAFHATSKLDSQFDLPSYPCFG